MCVVAPIVGYYGGLKTTFVVLDVTPGEYSFGNKLTS